MENFKEILFDVWQKVGRHIQITEALPLITSIVCHHLPLSQLLIRRFDESQRLIETIAIGIDTSPYDRYFVVRNCGDSEVTLLTAWFHQPHSLQRRQPQAEKLLSLLLPFDEGNDVIAGLLDTQGKSYSILTLMAQRSKKFLSQHIELLNILIEPLSIAVNNDNRFRELHKLKEAAEADKKSLLVKFHHKDIGDVLIGADRGLRTVMERVNLVAKSDVPVLIFGETGTGKELISRFIHNKSNHASGPFIRVNCGAIPSELIDSQLFGHERGAFTGAVERRQGWFEQADGGTLFLDEVGEMSLGAQVRLLRILQDGWMERVGGKQPIKVDVRIVLATHRDLASMVAAGTFREDLWYRISTFPIFLPPLRERLEDLTQLARNFSEQSAIRFGLPVLMPTKKDIELLASYSWPGNIRELGTVIDRAALLGNGHKLEIAKALGWSNHKEKPKSTMAIPLLVNSNQQALCSLDEAMKRHIEFALIQCNGKVEGKHGAAKLLKINPHTLRARMRKLGIQWSAFRI